MKYETDLIPSIANFTSGRKLYVKEAFIGLSLLLVQSERLLYSHLFKKPYNMAANTIVITCRKMYVTFIVMYTIWYMYHCLMKHKEAKMVVTSRDIVCTFSIL